MRRILLTAGVAVLLLIPPVEARQSFVEAFNFRETAAFVTDGANQTYVIPGDAYPTTRAGVTFGWTVNPTGCRDRNAALDVRLAGICFGSGVGTFRVDLPGAGTYNIGLSMGDNGSAQTATQIRVHDNATVKITVGPQTTAVDDFYDATNTLRSSTTWPTNQTTVSTSFATTTLLVTLDTATSNSVITHLSISGSPSGGGGGGCKGSLLGVGCE